jgi:membrane protein EpsK
MGFAGLSFVTNAVILLVSAVVTSRLYGVDVIGEYGLAMTPWLVLVSLSTVSEQVAMIHALAHMKRGSDEATGLVFAVLTMSTGLTALMSVPVLAIAGLVLHHQIGHDYSPWPAVVIVIGYLLFENPAWNLDSVLSAFNQGSRLFWGRLTTAIVFLTVAIVLYPFTESVWGLAIATVVSFAAGLVARVVAVRGLVSGWPDRHQYAAGFRRLPDLLRYGAKLLPQQFFVGLTLQAPLWFVAGATTPAQLGAYSRASTMAQRLDEAAYRINEMLFPDLVRMHLVGDREAFIGTLRRTLRLALVGLLLAAALAGGAAEPLMGIFGEGFASGAGAFTFLVLAHVCFVASSMVGAAYNSFGKPHLNSAFSVIRFAVGLALLALLVTEGITAASFGLFVGYFIELVVRTALVRRILDLPAAAIELSEVARLVVAYLAAFVGSRLVLEVVPSGLVGLMLALPVGALVFVGLTLATHLIDPDERNAIIGRVRRLARA